MHECKNAVYALVNKLEELGNPLHDKRNRLALACQRDNLNSLASRKPQIIFNMCTSYIDILELYFSEIMFAYIHYSSTPLKVSENRDNWTQPQPTTYDHQVLSVVRQNASIDGRKKRFREKEFTLADDLTMQQAVKEYRDGSLYSLCKRINRLYAYCTALVALTEYRQ